MEAQKVVKLQCLPTGFTMIHLSIHVSPVVKLRDVRHIRTGFILPVPSRNAAETKRGCLCTSKPTPGNEVGRRPSRHIFARLWCLVLTAAFGL